MQNHRFLSLFLFNLLCFFLLLGNLTTHAQESTDSLRYYYHLILTPKSPSDLSKGVEYYIQKKEMFLQKKDTMRAIQALRMMAIGQSDAGMVYDAQISAIEALTLLDGFHPTTERIQEAQMGLYNHLGRVYKTLKDYTNAVHMYENALALSVKSKDHITILSNLGLIYKEQQDFEKAEAILEKALEMAKNCEDPRIFARTLNNLGTVQAVLHNNEALPNIKEALQIRLSESESQGIYSSYIALSDYYKQDEEETQAIHYAELALDVSKNISPLFEVNALKQLLALRPSEKIEDYIRLTDSIRDAKLLQENKFAGIKYNLSEERARVQASELLREKEKRAKTTSLLISGFVILLLLLIVIIYRIKSKKDLKLKVFETESRISKKVHDEVANDVFQVMTKIQFQNPGNESMLDDLEKIYKKTRDISRESSPVEIQENFKEQLQDLLDTYQSDDTNISTQNISNIEWEFISEEKKITIYRVLQELMTNMKKHSEASIVHLSFNTLKKETIIQYTDNGCGTELKNKNGLLHMENRIEAIKGSIIFDSEPNKGFRVKIAI